MSDVYFVDGGLQSSFTQVCHQTWKTRAINILRYRKGLAHNIAYYWAITIRVIFIEEVSIVGVSSHVITDRTLTTPPNQQLLDTHPVITTTTPRDFTFTYQVSRFDL